MARLLLYSIFSLFLFFGAIYHAYSLYEQFFPTVLMLSTSKPHFVVKYSQCFVFCCFFGGVLVFDLRDGGRLGSFLKVILLLNLPDTMQYAFIGCLCIHKSVEKTIIGGYYGCWVWGWVNSTFIRGGGAESLLANIFFFLYNSFFFLRRLLWKIWSTHSQKHVLQSQCFVKSSTSMSFVFSLLSWLSKYFTGSVKSVLNM